MKMSTKGKYALEIAVDLALYSSDTGQLESLKNIAERRGLSEKYLERIIKALKQKGIVRSVRGARGGYALAKPPEQIRVREVFNAVEGQLAPVQCLTKETDCGISCDLCPTRNTWGMMWYIITDAADKVTVADIVEKVRRHK